VVKLYSGDCYVSRKPMEMLVTILGSCVAACIRDPLAGVGGMNHFLLPETSNSIDPNSSDAARYGAYAMEQLINQIMKAGGARNRLEVKVFGGGNVTSSTAMIGDKNVAFVRRFLKDEGLKIASEDLGGNLPRRIHYYPDTGRVMMRKLQRKEDMVIVERERNYASSLKKQTLEGEIDLF
jgi:chemotaxis protein CheD